MNAQRALTGGRALSTNGCLTSLAQGWARSMGVAQAISHNGGFASCNATAAENIGTWQPCSVGSMDAWWMGSAPHRANILDASFGSVGVGVWPDGNGNCWYVVDFGP
ncbi:MAG: CAP domain-containing protein [Acidimicrobiales bacterium]